VGITRINAYGVCRSSGDVEVGIPRGNSKYQQGDIIMITIKGTSKIKGALDLGSINKQLKAGDRIPLTDEDFSDHTVQIAVNMGFITYEKGGILDVGTNSNSIKIRNIYDRAIHINDLQSEVQPGQIFTLTENQVNSKGIRGALAKGLLEIVSSARITQGTDESNVRVGNIFDADTEETQENPAPSIGNNPLYLETNEEAPEPKVIEDTRVIDTDDPKPVEKKDIYDPKGKTVIWNPTHDPVTHTKTQMKSISISEDGVQETIESDVDVSDISFVDAELDQKRKQSHPILKNKPDTKNDGIDFL